MKNALRKIKHEEQALIESREYWEDNFQRSFSIAAAFQVSISDQAARFLRNIISEIEKGKSTPKEVVKTKAAYFAEMSEAPTDEDASQDDRDHARVNREAAYEVARFLNEIK